MNPSRLKNITAAILAGGRATRMGGQDKGLVMLNGRCMVEYVLDALRPQVGVVLINANRNHEEYQRISDCLVVADSIGHFDGPLAGMASCLQAAETELVLFAPCDSPLVSDQLAARLYNAMQSASAEISVATDGKRMQPVFALLRRDLLPDLLDCLKSGERKIDRWYARHALVQVDLSDMAKTFMNINTPEEHARLSMALQSAE